MVEGTAYLMPPELDEYEQHLVKLWREVGSVSQGGMGVAPLVWSEVIAWADRFYCSYKTLVVEKKSTKTIEKIVRGKPTYTVEHLVEEIPTIVKESALEDYEIEIIMQLSREYCGEYHSASEPDAPCPKEVFLDEVDALAESTAFGEDFLAKFVHNK